MGIMVLESAKHGSWYSNGDVWEHKQSPVCSFVKCYLQWQSEAKQGGSGNDSQECVETDWERSVLFVQVCVCVCELHPPRLWATWRDWNVVPVKAFFKSQKTCWHVKQTGDIFCSQLRFVLILPPSSPPRLFQSSHIFCSFQWHRQMEMFVTVQKYCSHWECCD